MLVVPFGLAAGVLTTVAGLGGGIALVLVLSLIWDPQTALAITAPALLVGNAHRLRQDWASLDRNIALRFSLGALPGSILGGFVAAALPEGVLKGLLVATTGLAVARELKIVDFTFKPSAMPVAGAVSGALAATGGGAGLLVAPIFLSAGLSGRAFIATSAATAVAMHAGRILAYGVSGMVTHETLLTSAVLAIAILAGNVLGKHVRERLSETATQRITYGTLIVAVGLAVAGIAS